MSRASRLLRRVWRALRLDRTIVRRAVLLVIGCAALIWLTMSDALHEALLGVLDAGKATIAAHPYAGPILFVLLSALSAMLAFVSTAILVPVAVYAWGEWVCMALLWLGWILGGITAYGIGRGLGPRVVRWLTAQQALQRVQARVQEDASFGLVLLFQLGVPSEIPGYALGLARYDVRKYLAALAIAELPYAFITVHLGASFLERHIGTILVLCVSLILLTLTVFFLLRRHFGRDSRPARPTSNRQNVSTRSEAR